MKIKLTYQIDDGYRGGARPQTTTIDTDDFEGMSEAEIDNALCEILQEDMLQRVSWSCPRYAEHVAKLVELANAKFAEGLPTDAPQEKVSRP